MSAITCAVAQLIAAAAICGWLSRLSLAQAMWPNDINATMVSLAGGTVGTTVLGEPEVSLGLFSVWIRLVALTAVFAAVSFWRHRNIQSESGCSTVCKGLNQTALIALLSSLWWLLMMAGDPGVPGLTRFCVGVLPQWVMLSVALFGWVWWKAIVPASVVCKENGTSRQPSSRGPIAFLAVAVLSWIAVSFWLNSCLYQQLMIPHGDSAMYEEHLWNIWHGKGFRSYLDQGLFLGEHIQVIHLLLLPAHMLWPSHLLLELTESIALASCAIPIYLIARRTVQSPWAAAALGVAWLFYFPMHFLDIAIDQKTFRPIALGLPFLFWMIEFAERRKFGWTAVCLCLTLSSKEDMALLACPLLAVLALMATRADATESPGAAGRDHRSHARNRLLGLSLFSALYLVAVVLVIIPAFRSGEHVHYSRYFGDLGGTPGELVKTALTDPLRVIAKAFSVRTLLYVCVFLGPLAFFPLRRPWLLAAGILTFGMLSLLEFGGPDSGGLPPVPYHHFHAPLLAVVFWAGIHAISEVKALPFSSDGLGSGMRDVQSRAVLVLFCCIATSLTGSLMPCGVGFWSQESAFGYSRLYASSDERQQKRAESIGAVVESIPADARVASTDYVHTRLTHCDRSYDYSGYLRKVNNYREGVPPDTDYIVIDTAHRYSEVRKPSDVRELQQEPENWELLPDTSDGVFLVLKRRDVGRR